MEQNFKILNRLFLSAAFLISGAQGVLSQEPLAAGSTDEDKIQIDEQLPLAGLQISSSPLTLGPELDAKYDKGIAFMYRLEFDKAEEEFREIVRMSSASPAGYFALSALSWWRCAQNFDVSVASSAYEEEFMHHVDETAKAAEAMLKKKISPDQAYFFMGSAYGLKGRWYAVQRKWFRAYIYGNRARKMLRKCVKLNPNIYDAYLGLGIFDYFADTLPGILSVPALLFVHGDRMRGLEEVRLARDKGRFFSVEARIFLIEILTRHEKDFNQAVAEAKVLRETDPGNPFLWLGEIMAYIHSQDWSRAFDESLKFLAANAGAENPWLAQQLSLVYLSAGDSKLALNQPQEAAAWFTQGIENTAYPDKGWISYCYLRRAQAFGLLGRKEEAVKDYKTALNRVNFWDSHLYAKKGLKKAPDFKEIYRQLIEE
ncbi:MAG TPA: hypothetical protein DCL44_09040 [Elusimicrobia bacterium]|nr:hypothetical protein [Elusimicrobiota bacterium]